MLHVIACELPFILGCKNLVPANACAVKDKRVLVYNPLHEFVPLGSYDECIDSLRHLVKEGKWQWADFDINEGDQLTVDLDNDIYINSRMVQQFRPISPGKGRISDRTLTKFNEFLKLVNKDSADTVTSLTMSLNDNFFREEVEDIVKDDVVTLPTDLHKEIMVRSKYEGLGLIDDYVKAQLALNNPDVYMDINYFFRQVFGLEKNSYVSYVK